MPCTILWYPIVVWIGNVLATLIARWTLIWHTLTFQRSVHERASCVCVCMCMDYVIEVLELCCHTNSPMHPTSQSIVSFHYHSTPTLIGTGIAFEVVRMLSVCVCVCMWFVMCNTFQFSLFMYCQNSLRSLLLWSGIRNDALNTEQVIWAILVDWLIAWMLTA